MEDLNVKLFEYPALVLPRKIKKTLISGYPAKYPTRYPGMSDTEFDIRPDIKAFKTTAGKKVNFDPESVAEVAGSTR